MKYRHWLVSALVASTLHALALAGATSSNGGGGDKTHTDGIVPIGGLGQIIKNARELDYQGRIETFIKSRPEVKIETCPNRSDLKFPTIPSTFEKSFHFLIHDRHFVTEKIKEAGAKTTEVSSLFNQNVEFNAPTLCKNSQWVNAYGTTVMNLYEIAEAADAGTELIRQTVALGGPITTVIQAERLSSREVGGNVEDIAWFNPKDASISFAPREPRGMIEAMIGRRITQIIRHEVAHVLLYRVLGAAYPKAKLWHDARFPVGMAQGWDPNWTKQRTSPDAAFIEGIADAMESDGFLGQSPFMMSTGNFNHLMNMNGKYCYWEPGVIQIDPSTHEIVPMLDNEPYASSTIATIFYRENIPVADHPTIESTPGRVVSVSNERIVAMIKAIIHGAPKNIQELAEAYDKETQGELGYRWYREFYFTDYKTQQSTATDLELSNYGNTTLCVKAGKNDLFYSPKKDHEMSAYSDQQNALYASRISREQVEKFVHSVLESSQAGLRKITSESPLDTAKARRESISKRMVDCSKVDDPKFGLSGDPTFSKIYENYRGHFPEMIYIDEDIIDFFKAGCKGKDIEQLRPYQDLARTLQAILDQKPADAKEHENQVFSATNANKRIGFAMERLRVQLRLVELLGS